VGVPTYEVGYTSATTGRGDHEVRKGHVVALEKIYIYSPEDYGKVTTCIARGNVASYVY
jgi:hypothetical protein